MTGRLKQLLIACPVLAVASLLVGGCWRDMYQQPRYDSYEPSGLFADSMSARPLVPGTVPRRAVIGSASLQLMQAQAESVSVPITPELLARGRERFTIYCSPCHGALGNGNGMIVQRGFTPPPSFHIERLRAAPAQHLYDVITNGRGRMYSYADRVSPTDRWAIVAYIRALQYSQHANVADLPPSERNKLSGGP
ncbi:MAG TPA: cytochrome c [Rhodothermales bacterium]|nr:cytochrome c [Rhodothermales bacterium]